MTEESKIKYIKDEKVAWIILNNQRRYNILDIDMRKLLINYLKDAENDDNIRVVVVKGEGKIFSAGADLRDFINMTSGDASKYIDNYGTSKVIGKIIRNMSKPVIAVVSGLCIGGGFELVQHCDIVIASEDSIFSQPELNIGLIPGGGGTQLLPRLIGEKKAKEMIFTGMRVSAEELEKLGLINRVVPEDDLDEVVKEIIEKITKMSPLTIAYAKKAINKSYELGLKEGLKIEEEIFTSLFDTEDFEEGIRAFFEKRRPKWKGR